MPFDLSLTHTRTSYPRGRGQPLWRRLQRLADAVRDHVVVLWQGLFADARARLTTTALPALGETGALGGVLQAVEAVWHTTVESPAQHWLPALLAPPLTTAGEMQTASLQATLGITLTAAPNSVAVAQVLDTYIGRSLREVSTTTLRAVQEVLRTGWAAQRPMPALVQELQTVLGLAPRQAQGLATLRARLVASGLAPARIEQTIQAATTVALHQRALMIARTTSMDVANLGAHLALRAAVEQGVVAAEQIRRFWVTAGESACPTVCLPIPELNPAGVGLEQEFETPIGPLLLPTAHPNCRCTVDVRIL